MENKGFTLIELLGVIILLSLIMIFAFPKITNSIKDSADKVDDVMVDLIYKATTIYISDNESNFNKVNGNSYCITLRELVDEDYLKSPVTVSSDNTDLTDIKSVEVTYNDGFTYVLKDKNDCIRNTSFIRGVTAENKTLAGKIPEGNFDLGDEYIVNVDGINEYHFYILSVEEDKVNLIMSDNVSSTGKIATLSTDTTQWMSNADYGGEESYYRANSDNKGSVTAMNYLYNATKGWKNLENVNDNYTDLLGKYTIITSNAQTKIIGTNETDSITAIYTNLKARMPRRQELLDSDCSSQNTCPKWLYNEDIRYWLADTAGVVMGDQVGAYSMYNGLLLGIVNSQSIGIRPVITISKSNF